MKYKPFLLTNQNSQIRLKVLFSIYNHNRRSMGKFQRRMIPLKLWGLVKSSICFSLLKRLLEKRSQKTGYSDINSVDGTRYEVYFD